MKPCWKDAGLTESTAGERAATQADDAIEEMCKLLEDIGDEGLQRIVFNEAQFRINEMPKRTVAFQLKYLKSNGFPCRCSNPKACTRTGKTKLFDRVRYCRKPDADTYGGDPS